MHPDVVGEYESQRLFLFFSSIIDDDEDGSIYLPSTCLCSTVRQVRSVKCKV